MTEILMVLVVIVGGVLVLILLSVQGRQGGELTVLRRQLQALQDQVNWLILAAREREKPKGSLQMDQQPAEAEQPSETVPTAQPPATKTEAGFPTWLKEEIAGVEAGAEEGEGVFWTCPACGKQNSELAKYCVYCGKPEVAEAKLLEQEPALAPGTSQSILTQPVTRESLGKFEQLVGERWMTWVGALFLVVALGAAVKWMFDTDLLSPWWRLVLECVLGLLVLLLGRYLLKIKMVALGQGMLGLGLAIFYVALYAAYHFHNLMSAPLTLTLVALATAGGMWIALRYEAVAIAVLALLGGLITPAMVSQGDDIQHVLFTYILVLDLGVMAVSLFKRWRMLDVAAFVGTALVFVDWVSAHYTPALLNPTMAWLGAFFLLFMLVPFAYSMRTKEPLEVERFVAALLNATAMILASWYFLAPGNLVALGLVSLAMSLCYLALSVAFRLRIPADERSHYGLMALSLVFVTLAVPLLFKFNAVIIVWAIEAPLLVWLGYRFDNRLVRGSAIPVLVVALLRLLFVHWPHFVAVNTVFFNPQFGTALFIPLGAGVAAWVHHYFSKSALDFDRSNKIALGLGGGLLALLLINREVSAYFAQLDMGGLQNQSYYSWTTQMLVWVIGVAMFMVAGIFWQSRAARLIAKILLGVAIIIGFWTFFGLMDRGLDVPGGHLLCLNFRFSAVLFMVIVIFMLAWLHSALADRLPEGERRLPVYLGILGGLLLLILFAGEISWWFAFQLSHPGPYEQIASVSWQTLVWALGAAGFLAAGLYWRCREAYLAGVAPLVFGALAGWRAYSVAHGPLVDPGEGGLLFLNIRFIFVLALVLAVFAYGLYIRRCRDICTDEDQSLATGAYVAADILLLILLSSEVYKFIHALDLPGREAANQANVALSVVWGVYALAFIVAGFWLKKGVLRLWALGLLGVTAFKLVLFDLSHMPPVFRLVSMLVTGMLMLVTAFLYHRAEKMLGGEYTD